MAAQHLPQGLVKASSGVEQLAQMMKKIQIKHFWLHIIWHCRYILTG